jgi:hypothetical protein
MGLAEAEGGWWWCSGMIGNMLVIGLENFGMLVLGIAKGRMGSGAVYGGALHGVVNVPEL